MPKIEVSEDQWAWVSEPDTPSYTCITLDIHLHSPYNMVAQSNRTGTSKNTTNDKNNRQFHFTHINYVTFNSQYPLQILNHLA